MPDRRNLRFERGLIVAEEAPQGQPELWRHDHRTGHWITHAMNQWRLESPLGDEATLWESVHFPRIGQKTLRCDQIEAMAAWKRTGRGVVVMPTGSGKTEVALGLMREIAAHTLFVAPTRALAYQLAGRIEDDCGVEVGFIGDSTYRLRPICVTTYDSAGIKMEHLGNYFKLVVFDECHHLPGDLRADAARMSAAPFRLGLTATPRRSDGGERHYEELIGPVCYEFPLAVARGTVLADYSIKRIPVYLTDQEQAHYDALGETISGHIANHRRDSPGYCWKDVIKNLDSDPAARRAFLARLKRRSMEEHASAKLDVLEDLFHEHLQQVVVFTGSNIMARVVSTRFLIPCLLAHSRRKEREEILRGYRAGEYRAIIANKVLNEGVDVPAAKVGIVIGGSGSEREAVQRLGRILRQKGQQSATLYEVVCTGTGEEERSRKRRRNDAYKGRSDR
jgi:superfamily II DNA or RNA helicase